MDKSFYNMCKKQAKKLLKEEKASNLRIFNDYENEFTILEAYWDFSNEIGNTLDSFIPQVEKPVLQFVLLRLHERAIKVYREAVILLENGSASGAMARWRTLYEFSVVSCVILKYPELAIKYFEYNAVDEYRCAKKLLDYRDKLKLANFDFSAFPDIEADYERVKKKYNWQCSATSSYEWAKNAEITSPNLFNLAKAVNLEYLYPYVYEAHKYNHSSMKYLLNDRGSVAPDNNVLHYLFSPFDMELPMQLVVISLHKVNQAVIEGYEKLDSADVEKLAYYLFQNKSFPDSIIELCSKRLNVQEADHAD